MKHLIQYGIPALLVGAIVGYFVADIRHQGEGRSAHRTSSNEPSGWFSKATPSAECEPIDYDRLARVCSAAQSQGRARTGSSSDMGVLAGQDGRPLHDKALAQQGLELILTQSIEAQLWSQRSGMHSRSLLMKADPTEAETFENLLVSAIRGGQLKVEAGAWIPARVADAIQM